MAKNETFSVLTGGAADSLDGILTPSNDDFAFGNVSGLFHGYTFDTSETGVENSPYQIKADDATTGSWMLGGFQGAMSHVEVNKTSAQSLSGSIETIIFNIEDEDALAEYNNTTGVFTASYTGKYLVCAGITFESTAWVATETAYLNLEVNGSVVKVSDRQLMSGDTGRVGLVLSTPVKIVATNTLEVSVIHDHGSSVGLNVPDGTWNWLTIDRIA